MGFVFLRGFYGSSGELQCIKKYPGVTEGTWRPKQVKRAGELLT